jgi:hypothetical protein
MSLFVGVAIWGHHEIHGFALTQEANSLYENTVQISNSKLTSVWRLLSIHCDIFGTYFS